jgi:hypothetical protein
LNDHQINCLGVDPASNIANVAKEKGLNVINDFFGKDLAKKIIKEYGHAEIIVANAVFAHIDDMDDMTNGITELLSNSGIFIFEVHHLVDIIEDMQYDSFYHEHFSYHSITTLSKFLKKHNMEICDVKKFPVRGGMIRVYAKKIGNENKINSSVDKFITMEKNMGLDKFQTFKKFGELVAEHKSQILKLLNQLKSEGKKIVAYGMSGRGNTLLNYWKVDTKIIDYGIDASPERYNRLVPGMHIPIISPEKSLVGVDYALLLAWIFKDDIMKKESGFIQSGGKFIIPMPHPHFEP